MGICDGRVVLVTGAGRGIGRGHALEFANQGAKVVVNDLGAEVDGTGSSTGPAGEVVDEIRAKGGEAIANGENVADYEGARRMVQSAIDEFGKLDVLVCNAGILRDRMLFNMEEAEWDAVINVHLKGTFAPSRHAAAYWREQSKKGEEVDARIITTTSSSGLFNNPGQANYGAAKAAIASFTIIAARELEKYGVMCNSISPGARTRMTENLGRPPAMGDASTSEFDARSPDNVAPIVVWLGSKESRGITGRVFNASGGTLGLSNNWSRGPHESKDGRWDPGELGPIVKRLVEQAPPVWQPRPGRGPGA